jgi:hypothetical protein
MTDLGVRVGFVYKTTDNDWQTYRPFRPPSAYTRAVNVVDPGLDGRAGTADDGSVTVFGVPTELAGQFPLTNVIQNVDAIGRWKTLELAANKRFSNRWSMVAGFGYTWTEEHNTAYASNTFSNSYFPNSPNDISLNEFTGWGFRIHGTYEAPHGIRLSPILRHQAGQPYGRFLSVTLPAASQAIFSGPVLVEPIGTRRQENITIFDIRAEKTLRFGSRFQVRGFLDVFNILNSAAPETIRWTTGSTFENPTIILAPRVLRVGFRFDW